MTEFRAVAVGTADAPPIAVAEPPLVLVGGSAALEGLRRDLIRLAATDEPVLIHGEAGSGKSIAARVLHELGPRGQRSCTVVACHAIPETLLHVELFGCASGSVVGATCDREGVLERARGGTVILENIDSMNSGLQVVLARFLTSGRVQAVGASGPGLPVLTRVLVTSTTSERLGAADRRMHPELSARLAARLRIPPLRERQSDIPALAQFFARMGTPSTIDNVRFEADAMRALSLYPWPGNVSQLRAVVERLAATAGGTGIQAADLPVGIRPRMGGTRGAGAKRSSVGEELFAHVQASGLSFWNSVYPLFMKREITRADLRDLVRRARDAARGDVDAIVQVLNMPGSDRPKFVRFLRKYNCELAL